MFNVWAAKIDAMYNVFSKKKELTNNIVWSFAEP